MEMSRPSRINKKWVIRKMGLDGRYVWGNPLDNRFPLRREKPRKEIMIKPYSKYFVYSAGHQISTPDHGRQDPSKENSSPPRQRDLEAQKRHESIASVV